MSASAYVYTRDWPLLVRDFSRSWNLLGPQWQQLLAPIFWASFVSGSLVVGSLVAGSLVLVLLSLSASFVFFF